MKLEFFELNFSGKHFQTLERETSKFERRIWERFPLLHQSDTDSTRHTWIVSFVHQQRWKGKRHVLLLKDCITIIFQPAEAFASEVLFPSVLPIPKRMGWYMIIKCALFVCFFVRACGMWKFLGQGIKPAPQQQPKPLHDNAGSLTHCATRELLKCSFKMFNLFQDNRETQIITILRKDFFTNQFRKHQEVLKQNVLVRVAPSYISGMSGKRYDLHKKQLRNSYLSFNEYTSWYSNVTFPNILPFTSILLKCKIMYATYYCTIIIAVRV